MGAASAPAKHIFSFLLLAIRMPFGVFIFAVGKF
jgi:hypothetical protein